MRDLVRRVEDMLGRRVIAWDGVERGYTPAARFVARFSDGSSAFVKAATNVLTSEWLRREHSALAALGDTDFAPRLLAFDASDAPLLVLEDLSDAHWPPPWRTGDVELLLATLQRVAAHEMTLELGSAPETFGLGAQWQVVADEPEAFLSLGLCSRRWLDDALPRLMDAERRAPLDGDDLLHMDVRSDNVCFTGARAVLVDWNWLSRGHRDLDVACWLPSLRLEGGPLPDEVQPDAGGYAACLAGFWAARAGLPDVPDAPRVRWIQRRQLRIALPWAARALGLPAPDGRWAQAECDTAARDFESGRIDEPTYHARVEEPLIDAYLSQADLRAQSGKSGDEDEWRWSRELVLDVVPDGAAVLDVGAANGYLMESLERWARERGMRIDVYGLEISARMAEVARRRLPHWSDRIWCGDAMTFHPPRRFDVVHGALDYAAPGRQRDLVDRLLADYLVPGGIVVFRAERVRAERVRAGVADVVAQLHAVGRPPGGVVEAVHPASGEIRRTAWIRA